MFVLRRLLSLPAAAKFAPRLASSVFFMNADVCDVRSLAPFTHLYMADRVSLKHAVNGADGQMPYPLTPPPRPPPPPTPSVFRDSRTM